MKFLLRSDLINLKASTLSALSALSVTVLLASCGSPPNVAGDYLKTKTGTGDASGTVPETTPAATPAAAPTVAATPAATPAPAAAPTAAPAATGDKTAGLAILSSTCGGCHAPPAAAAMGNLLNAANASRLDEAKAKVVHAGFAAYFTGTNRLNIEAAMKSQ